MKPLFFKRQLLLAGLFIAFCSTAFINKAHAGLDYYEIFIGKKLIMKRAVNQLLSIESLPLTQANINEQVVINYFQCNAPNKIAGNRIITLKDADGNTVKQWKFANAQGANTAMMIPVKDLLQMQKSGKKLLALFYAAEGKVKEEKLVFVTSANKTIGFIKDVNQNKINRLVFIYNRVRLIV